MMPRQVTVEEARGKTFRHIGVFQDGEREVMVTFDDGTFFCVGSSIKHVPVDPRSLPADVLRRLGASDHEIAEATLWMEAAAGPRVELSQASFGGCQRPSAQPPAGPNLFVKPIPAEPLPPEVQQAVAGIFGHKCQPGTVAFRGPPRALPEAPKEAPK